MIELANINKSFAGKQVLKDISLTVNKGSCNCLIGNNGAGKSTLINILLGILEADSGVFSIKNLTYKHEKRKLKKLIGCIPENSMLIEEMTGYEYLLFFGMLFSIKSGDLEKRITDLNHLFFRDGQVLHTSIYTYSTGMKRRLEFCSALIHSPEIIILDEPFSGLDPEVCNSLLKILNQLLKNGKTIFISSHDLGYVREIATDITLISNGEIIFKDKKENFFTLGESELTTFFKYNNGNVNENIPEKLPEWC